jgi:peptidoglycan/xylan/chitin deacetylase (PgdA/CDA1 family)
MIDHSFISLEALAGKAFRVTRLDRLRRRLAPLNVPILMYHSIVADDSDPEACLSLVGMTTRESRFREHMEYVAHNYRSVLLEDLLRWKRGEASLPDYSCIITFDDGLVDVYERAVPILQEHGLRAVVFPIGSTLLADGRSYLHDLYAILDNCRIDTVNRAMTGVFAEFPADGALDKASLRNWASHHFHNLDAETRARKLAELRTAAAFGTDVAPLFMSVEQLKHLAELGFEIGSHSMNHGFLTQLSLGQLKAEIAESSEMIENLTGERPVSFCYPYGVRDSRATEILKEQGYLGAVTMIEGLNKSNTNPWELRRIRITWNLSLEAFVFRLLGARALLWSIREFTRSGQ